MNKMSTENGLGNSAGFYLNVKILSLCVISTTPSSMFQFTLKKLLNHRHGMYVCVYNFAIQINKVTIYDKKGKKTKVKSIYNNTKFTGRRKKAK